MRLEQDWPSGSGNPVKAPAIQSWEAMMTSATTPADPFAVLRAKEYATPLVLPEAS